MTWNPTHVQFTVLRARNLLVKSKGGKGSADVFVTIQLGKEKYQTTTLKYGAKKSAEWLEECDLSIPDMNAECLVHVMHRGLLSDEFMGFAAVPLSEYSVYDRPKNEWLQLQGKPHKPPDNKYRGEVEVRLTFHVKSRTDDTYNQALKGKRTPSLRSLGSAIGEKLKFSRSRSLRWEVKGQDDKSKKKSSGSPSSGFVNEHSSVCSDHGFESASDQKLAPEHSMSSNCSTDSTVNFPAVDLYFPGWNECDESSLEGNFNRSYSLTMDKRKQGRPRQERDFRSLSLYNLPTDKSMTLPTRGRRQRPALDDSVLGSYDDIYDDRSSGSAASGSGYIFEKEREVYSSMTEHYDDSIIEEQEPVERRKSANIYEEDIDHGSSRSLTSSSSGSTSSSEDSDEGEVTLPKVKYQENSGANLQEQDQNRLNETVESQIKEEEDVEHGSNTQDVSNTQTDTRKVESDTDIIESSHSESDLPPDTRIVDGQEDKNSKSRERTFYQDLGSSDSISRSKKKITPDRQFEFAEGRRNGDVEIQNRRRNSRQTGFKEGSRRYTIQGLNTVHRQTSLPDCRPSRPFVSKEDAIPEDLMAVYQNMTRGELIKLVITHKAQLIRKDKYIKDLEKYIDDLLVRVMETTPKLLQSS